MAIPLSILIPVKNEAENIGRCLNSVAWAEQVFVVDSASTDDTAEIARKHGAEVVQFNFNGSWPKKKNWALEYLPFRHPWVFILDADETLPAEAEAEFAAIVNNPDPPHAGYWINRRFMFMGKWLRHAYFPNWNLRLFQHRRGRYERLTEGDTRSGDNEVHEHIIVAGSTGRLRCLMDHYAFPSVEVFVEKHNRYSNWEARLLATGQAAGPQDSGVRRRRCLKTWARRLPCRPLLRFCYVYFWQLGFLDGREGYYFARLHGVYELLSAAKAHELRRTAGRR